MPSAAFSFEPGQTVWCIVGSFAGPAAGVQTSTPPYVQKAIVKSVDIVIILPTTIPTVQYTVTYTGQPVSGSAILTEGNVFPDVDSALTEYRRRITAP